MKLRSILFLGLMALLGGCNFVVMSPAGDVAAQQRNLIIVSTVLMLLIIIPVMALTALFAWRYRSGNKAAVYLPNWSHSTQLELVIWAAPLLIIICLGAITWSGTHMLDPYRQIGRISATEKLPAKLEPLVVDVVALDWKWLFIYPELGIATVNDVAAPVDRAIDFHITSSSVMNSFYIPALAGQIYAMPGMETKMHAVINEAGDYRGISANYSGAGFSGMHFTFHGLSPDGFKAWVDKAKAAGGMLDGDTYLALERPSENEPVRTFAAFTPGLYDKILNLCVEPGKMCVHEMASIDAKGGLGLAGVNNILPLVYDKTARRGTVFGGTPGMLASICTTADPLGTGKQDTQSAQDAKPVQGGKDAPADAASLLPAGTQPLKGANLPKWSPAPLPAPAASIVLPRNPSNS